MCGASSSADLGQRGGRRQPAGRTAHRLEDHVLIDAFHVAGEHAGLLDRKGHVAGRAAEAGRVVGAAQIVVDRLGHAHADQFVALLAAIALHAMDGVHRVVAADEEEIADVVPAEHVQDARESRRPSACAGNFPGPNWACVRRPLDRGRRLPAQVDQFAAHEALDAEAHAQHAVRWPVAAGMPR